MKEKKWKKWLLIDRRFPKRSYYVRTLVGIYLVYVVYNIFQGLKEPDVTSRNLVIAAMVFLTIAFIFCIASGGLGLYFKEYKEMYDDEEAEENSSEDKYNSK